MPEKLMGSGTVPRNPAYLEAFAEHVAKNKRPVSFTDAFGRKFQLGAQYERTLRRGSSRFVDYESNDGLKLTVDETNPAAPRVVRVEERVQGNLKVQRTDSGNYRWSGDLTVGQNLGLNPDYHVNRTVVDSSFSRSSMSNDDIVLYRQVPSTPRPTPDELQNQGYGTRMVRAAHRITFDDRDSANTVMGASATVYAGEMAKARLAEEIMSIQRNQGVRPSAMVQQWESFSLPVSYEWCHLIGHGDGGREIPENFVAGSHYANTEQLAIETGLRKFAGKDLSMRVTAYVKPVRKGITVDAYSPDWVHYEILDKDQPVFSHMIDMHRTGFDETEWDMLDASVEKQVGTYLLQSGRLSINQAAALHQDMMKWDGARTAGARAPPTGRVGRGNKEFDPDHDFADFTQAAYQAAISLRAGIDKSILPTSQ